MKGAEFYVYILCVHMYIKVCIPVHILHIAMYSIKNI